MTEELVSGFACCGILVRGSGPGWSQATITSRPTKFLTATGTPASVAWRSARRVSERIVALRWRPRGLGSLSQAWRRVSVSVQRRVAAVDHQGLAEQLSMQRFGQDGRWPLDKQSRHFFQAFWHASVLQNASRAEAFTPRLHKARATAGATFAGTGRTRSANPGRPPEATAGGATRGAS